MLSEMINKVICGDCLPILKSLPDKCIDLVLTDPPYGIKRDKGFEGFGGFGKPIARKRYVGGWDDSRPKKEVFDEILRISKFALIFGGNFFADILPQGNHWIFWDKLNTMPAFGDGELIWTNIDRNSVKKYTLQWNGLLGKEEFRHHPTQKPVTLMEYLLQTYAEPTDLICDPFAGSGSTLVACKKLNRRFIGIEISPEYCKIAEQRLKQGVLNF